MYSLLRKQKQVNEEIIERQSIRSSGSRGPFLPGETREK